MNAQQAEAEATGPSLDKTLHGILDEVAAARVAAMQILVFHMQRSGERQDLPPDEFMEAKKQISDGLESLHAMQGSRLDALEVALPDALTQKIGVVADDLGALMRILEKCSKDADEGVKGYSTSGDMYDLCCTRVAKGIGALTSDLSAFFLELTEKDKAEAQDKTSTIAMEIGKIGRVINMVATNASIEAARAGDAGKGFTVIADEVKTLSSRVSSLSVSLTDRLQ